MPYRAFAAGDVDTAREMIEAVRATCGDAAKLKVIIEAGELGSDDLVREASLVAIDAGADFIKTSTGKVAVNATPHFADIMIGAIAEVRQTGRFQTGGRDQDRGGRSRLSRYRRPYHGHRMGIPRHPPFRRVQPAGRPAGRTRRGRRSAGRGLLALQCLQHVGEKRVEIVGAKVDDVPVALVMLPAFG